MRREKDRVFFAQFADQGAHRTNLGRIEPGGRLVEDQYRGIGQQGVGEADALAVTFRQSADDLPANVAEPAAFEDIFDASPPRVAVEILDAAAETKVFLDAHLKIERAAFRHVADIAAHAERIPEDIMAGDGGRPGGGGLVAGEDAHRGALAGAVVAEEADNLPALDVEGDVLDGGVVAIKFRQSTHMNHASALAGSSIGLRAAARDSSARRQESGTGL